jgi:beta-lactamase regulating signal transducer with metallopeptidase domain
MNPDLLLTVVAALAAFLLKTTLGFALCWLLTRLASSANLRFILWSGFVYTSALYWLWLANSLIIGWHAPIVTAIAPRAGIQAAAASAHPWQIPSAFAVPLGLALQVIGIVYLLVLGYMLVAHARRRRHLKWVLGFTSEPPLEIAATFQSLLASLHIRRSKLLVLSGVPSPATFGWLRPTILLPTFCLEQDRAELEDILRHELHHVRRRDSVWNGLSTACRALLFFHPAVWFAVRKMQFDRELACDLAVVSHCPARKASYAECLLAFARLNLVQDSKSWGIDFAAAADQLTVRVHSILAVSKRAPRWLLCLRAASACTLTALAVAIAPSLVILLSYAPQPVSITPLVENASSPIGREARPTRKLHTSSPLGSKQFVVAGSQQATAMGFLPDRTNEDIASTQGNKGPQLLHRSAAKPSTLKSQTIDLTDMDASGQPVKEGRDTKQALQQSATAALAMYKRVSDLDRH